ncbi:hypothetical protein [Stenotrophomonas sp. GZD-301]|uniref:hypothetical protein n=1 Tax=Stenotrophomonas sp. GZD-301 TaxID=3404814 RepID=UPI003BB6B60C
MSLPNPDCRPDVIRHRGQWVARLHQRVDNGLWFAELDVQRERRHKRPCQSYDTGIIGVELWVERHQDRLRTEVLAKYASAKFPIKQLGATDAPPPGA